MNNQKKTKTKQSKSNKQPNLKPTPTPTPPPNPSPSPHIHLSTLIQTLKSRNISTPQLHSLITPSVLSSMYGVYYSHPELQVQLALFALQVYSHYPIRKLLYACSEKVQGLMEVMDGERKWEEQKERKRQKQKDEQKQGKQGHFWQLVLGLLIRYGNKVDLTGKAVGQCLEGMVNEGGMKLVQNFGRQLWQGRTDQKLWQPIVRENVKFAVKKIQTAAVYKVLSLLIKQLSSAYKDQSNLPTTSSKNSLHNSFLLSSKTKSKKRLSFFLTCLIAQLTHALPLLPSPAQLHPIKNQPSLFNILTQLFHLYIDNQAKNIIISSLPSLPSSSTIQLLQSNTLLYRWCVYSICSQLPLPSSSTKIKTHLNNCKQFFEKLMSQMQRVILVAEQKQRNSRPLNEDPEPNINKIHHLITLTCTLLSIFPYCFPVQNKSESYHNLNNSNNNNKSVMTIQNVQYKFMTLIRYNQIILYVVNCVNIEDFFNQQATQAIIGWLCNVAGFCDEWKKKHRLEDIINRIKTMKVTGDQQNSTTTIDNCNNITDFEYCQSVLYRILISIEKCLPKYPLKYYDKQYVARPGMFHLYFIDMLLTHRQPQQLKHFLLQLIQQWAGLQTRDFNILGYMCKFITQYLGRNLQAQPQPNPSHLHLLLAFFRQLTPRSLLHLNSIFFHPSLPTTPPPPCPTLNTPLSFPIQQSQLLSSGYALQQRTILIDHFFTQIDQLYIWSTLLQQICQDQYYYHCKYFYYLVMCAYTERQKSTLGLGGKVDEVIGQWQAAIQQGRLVDACAIMQVLVCWQYQYVTYGRQGQGQADRMINGNNQRNGQPTSAMNHNHVKQILSILLTKSNSILQLPELHLQNWRQALKHLLNPSFPNQPPLYDPQKQQHRTRTMHLLLLRNIIKFIEILPNLTQILPTNIISLQQVMQTIQKYAQTAGMVCWRSLRVLSMTAGRGVFAGEARRNLGAGREMEGLEVMRELVLGCLEEGTGRVQGCNKEAKEAKETKEKELSRQTYQQHPHDPTPTQHLLSLQLNLSLPQIFTHSLSTLCSPSSSLPSKTLALQIITQFFTTYTHNHLAFEAITTILKQQSQIFKKFKYTVMEIVMRGSVLVSRYDRRRILGLRMGCLALVVGEGYLGLGELMGGAKGKENGGTMTTSASASTYSDLFLTPEQLYSLLFHCCLDQQPQLRLHTLSLLTSPHHPSRLHSRLPSLSALLLCFSALDPRPKLRSYARQTLHSVIQKLSSGSMVSYLLSVLIEIGRMVYNSRVNVPYIEILTTYTKQLLNTNTKDHSYLLLSAIQYLQQQTSNYIYKDIFPQQMNHLGNDLRVYYMNVREKRGWVVAKQRQGQGEDRMEGLWRGMKTVIAERNSRVKLLRGRKEGVLEVGVLGGLGLGLEGQGGEVEDRGDRGG